MSLAFDPRSCGCLECNELAYELGGWTAAARFARRVQSPSWAGTYGTAELLFCRKHPPRWWVERRIVAREAYERGFRAFVYGVRY